MKKNWIVLGIAVVLILTIMTAPALAVFARYCPSCGTSMVRNDSISTGYYMKELPHGNHNDLYSFTTWKDYWSCPLCYHRETSERTVQKLEACPSGK